MAECEGEALPFMVSNHGIALALVLTLATGLVFALAPGLDLTTAGLFYAGHGHFVGQTHAGEVLRKVLYVVPSLVLACAVLLAGVRYAGRAVRAPTPRGLAVLVLSFAIGPGLLVNVMLKDHSHRPRPVQTDVFGGADAFRPIATRDGACRRNCSFVSGEGASSFWTVAPALMVPAPFRAVALGGALAYAALTGVLRLAFGGHYLSDALLAALFTWLVVAAVWRGLLGRRRPALTDR